MILGLKKIQHTLDMVGMYRAVTLALLFLVICSFGAAAVGWLAYDVVSLASSLLFVVTLAFSVNVALATLLRITANHESAIITALLLFFLFLPPQTVTEWWWLGVATVAAVASKFIVVWRKQHIVNAAAFGAVVVSLPYVLEAYWWAGTDVLFIPLLLAGLAVVAKVRKWTLVFTFIATAFIVFLFEEWRFGNDLLTATDMFFTAWPALFLAFFMLTEPFTMPGTRQKQIIYAMVVGFLSSTTLFTPYFAMTPELALVIGNVAMFPFTLRQKLFLTLSNKYQIAHNTWEFVFSKPKDMHFRSGQYLEWMLPHEHADSRGLRRYFTIASAPEEEVVRLAVRVDPERGSSYKKALVALTPGQYIIASQRAGDFLLPTNVDVKFAFVAGGIGVTPFSSHLAHMQLNDSWRDTVLYYCNNTHADIAYASTFSRYTERDEFSLVNVLAKEHHPDCEYGYLTKDIITKHTPDYQERIWYLSGPPRMVDTYYTLLVTMGVSRSNIHRDFFPGLA